MVSILPFLFTDSCSTSSPCRLRFSFTLCNFRPFNPIPSRLSKQKPLRFPSLKIVASSSLIEDGSAEQFSENYSIADFMRFKRGSWKGTAQLQTAVVSYKKKLPWSLLPPFLQAHTHTITLFILPLSLIFLFFSYMVFKFGVFQVDLVSTIHIADKEYVLFQLFSIAICPGSLSGFFFFF